MENLQCNQLVNVNQLNQVEDQNQTASSEKPSLSQENKNQHLHQDDNCVKMNLKTEIKDSALGPIEGIDYTDLNVDNSTSAVEHINGRSAIENRISLMETETLPESSIPLSVTAGFVIPDSFDITEESPSKDTKPTASTETLIHNVRNVSELSNSGFESKNSEESILNSNLPSESQNVLLLPNQIQDVFIVSHEDGDYECNESERTLVSQNNSVVIVKRYEEDENASESGSNVTEIDSELAEVEDDNLREKITDQLNSVSLSNIFVNNLHKYISKENVFNMLQYGEKIGILKGKKQSVQSLGWKIKQLRVLKKELTGIEDRMDDDFEEPNAGIGRGRRKRRRSQVMVTQVRKLTKKRLKDFEKNGESMDKNTLARALDLRVNHLDGAFDDEATENEVESDSNKINKVSETVQPKRRGRKPRSKAIKADIDVIINEKRSCRGRNVPQQFDMDTDEDEPEPEKEKPKRGRRPSIKNSSNNDSNPIARIKRSTLPNLTISPSSKSKKKIKLIIDKFETANLTELTPKNLYQFLTKAQVVEYLEFGKRSLFIDFDTLEQPVVWRLDQLKLLQNKLVDYNQKVKQHEAEYKRMRRQDPEYRERERQRNKEAKRKLRQDPEYRKQELINMTRARQLAKFRKLQLEFIEQEELMLEKRLLEGSDFPPPTPTPAPTPISLFEAQTPMPIDPEPEPEIIDILPSNDMPQSQEYNLNEGTGHFDVHGHHDNSNINSIPVHITAPTEFMDNNNTQHPRELKQTNNYVPVSRENSPHCGMMVQDNVMQPQTHAEHIAPVTTEMRPPSNDFVHNRGNVSNQLMVPMHINNRDHQNPHQHELQQEQHHRMLIDHNDYTCMNRENVVYHHHELVQNKFVHRPDTHDTHSAMSDHNVSFTSLLINNQLLDCELQGDHE